MKNIRKEWELIINDLSDIYIYGAGKFGKILYKRLKKDGKASLVKGFLVSSLENNPNMIEDKLVIAIDDFLNKEARILIAVPYRYQEEVINSLRNRDFKNIINAERFLFMEVEDVDIMETRELILRQYDDKRQFNRYDIIIYLLMIEEYYKDNSRDFSLLKSVGGNEGLTRMLGCFYEYIDKDFADSEIIINADFKILDGTWQLAQAIYHKYPYVRVRKADNKAVFNYNISWVQQYFERKKCEKIVERLKELLSSSEIYRDSREKLVEEIKMIYGKEQEFGDGELYQSFEELNIKGIRPTRERIVTYGLTPLIYGKKVFDIGCNCGFLDISLRKIAQSVKGIEYNRSLVKIAELMKVYLGCNNISFEVGDFRTYQTQERYDVVFSFAVHHWIGLPPEEYCKKIILMLKEKGCILFESHGTPIEDPEFYDYCVEFEKNGLVKVKEGKICDDGKCMRDFFIYKKLD